jgi:hypothetical protein
MLNKTRLGFDSAVALGFPTLGFLKRLGLTDERVFLGMLD